MAIVDLELAFDQATAISIKKLWTAHECDSKSAISSNAIEAATINIILDFAFIMAYAWFFIVLVALTQHKDALEMDKLTLLGCYGALTASTLDIIENIFMLIFLIVGEISSLWFAIPATIKFAIIALLIIWVLIRIVVRQFKKVS